MWIEVSEQHVGKDRKQLSSSPINPSPQVYTAPCTDYQLFGPLSHYFIPSKCVDEFTQPSLIRNELNQFQEMEIIKLNARSRDSAETTIRYHLDHIQEQDNEETSSVVTATEELSEMSAGIGRGGRSERKNRALVIDGKTLIYILDRRANLQVTGFSGFCPNSLLHF